MVPDVKSLCMYQKDVLRVFFYTESPAAHLESRLNGALHVPSTGALNTLNLPVCTLWVAYVSQFPCPSVITTLLFACTLRICLWASGAWLFFAPLT